MFGMLSDMISISITLQVGPRFRLVLKKKTITEAGMDCQHIEIHEYGLPIAGGYLRKACCKACHCPMKIEGAHFVPKEETELDDIEHILINMKER